MEDDLITTEQAAEILGVTQRRVVALIQSGRLPAKTYGKSRQHFIRRADLALVKARKTGRPKPKPDKEPDNDDS